MTKSIIKSGEEIFPDFKGRPWTVSAASGRGEKTFAKKKGGIGVGAGWRDGGFSARRFFFFALSL